MNTRQSRLKGKLGLAIAGITMVGGLGVWSAYLTVGYVWAQYGCTNGWLLHVATALGAGAALLMLILSAFVWREAIGGGDEPSSDDSSSDEDLSPEDDRTRFMASQGFYVSLLGLYAVTISEIGIVILGCG